MSVTTSEHATVSFDPVEAKALGVSKDPNVPYFTEAPINLVNSVKLHPDQALVALSEVYLTSAETEQTEFIGNILDKLRTENPGMTVENPDAICCIPVAATDEPINTLKTLVTVLANQNGAHYREHLIYGNYPKNNEDYDRVSEEKMSEIKSWTRQRYPELPIRFINVGYDPDDVSISKVRSDYMGVVHRDALERGLPYQQPIIWLDADTPFMETDALTLLAADAREGSSDDVFSRSNINFWLQELGYDGTHSHQLPEPVRATIFFELARRHREQNNLRKKTSYPEECGLAMALGNYVALGGVRRDEPYNEGANMVDSAVLNAPRLLPLTRKLFPPVRSRALPVDISNEIGLPILSDAVVYTSPRRLVFNAERILSRIERTGHQLTEETQIDGEYNYFGVTDICRRATLYCDDYTEVSVQALMRHTAHILAKNVRKESRQDYLDTVLPYMDQV